MTARILPVCLVVIGVSLRFLPHPANFAPVAAVALFGGVYLSRRWAVILPLLVMLMSDLLMSVPEFRSLLPWGAGSAGFHLHTPYVWFSFILVGLIGLAVRKRKSPLTIVLGSLAGSIVFYLVTNWAVWAFGTMYAPDFGGLVQSYVRAIPFFRNTLLGDLVYTGALFGLYESVRYFARIPARREVITR